jgi:nitrate reductase beta subunit
VKHVLKKLMAVRIYRRDKTVGDIDKSKVTAVMKDTGLTPEEAEGIYYLTSLAKFDDRFVIPAAHREQSMEMLEFTGDTKGNIGFGFTEKASRGI